MLKACAQGKNQVNQWVTYYVRLRHPVYVTKWRYSIRRAKHHASIGLFPIVRYSVSVLLRAARLYVWRLAH